MDKKQTHLIYGGITGLVIVVFLAALYISGNIFKAGLSSVAYLIFLIGLILNAINYSKANDADVTFGQVFGSCFKATALALIIIIVWNVSSFYIFPDMKGKYIEFMREKAFTQAGVNKDGNQEAVEKGMAMVTDHLVLIITASTAFYNLIAGAIFSLIAAAIAKKNPRPVYEG